MLSYDCIVAVHESDVVFAAHLHVVHADGIGGGRAVVPLAEQLLHHFGGLRVRRGGVGGQEDVARPSDVVAKLLEQVRPRPAVGRPVVRATC